MTSLSEEKPQATLHSNASSRSGRLSALLILLPPALLIFTLFVIFPVILAGVTSLYKYRGYGPLADFNGLNNYIWIFTKRTLNAFFEPALRNTALLLATSIFLQLPLALLCALMLYKESFINSIYRLILFLPSRRA